MVGFITNILVPAKTYIFRGTPRTYAIQARAVTDNKTMKKGPRKGNRGPVRGTDDPVSGTEGPVTGTSPLLLLIAPVALTVLIAQASCGSLRNAQSIGLGRT